MPLMIHTTLAAVSHQPATAVPRLRYNGRLRVLVGVISLWLIHGLLLIAVHGISHTASTDHGLEICEGLPCFNGITPGVTAWLEAKRIAETLGRPTITDTTIFYKNQIYATTVYRSADGLTVGTVDVVMSPDASFTIGDVVQRFGAPCGVSFFSYPNNGLVILHYPLAAVSVLSSNRLTEDMSVRYMTFFDAVRRASLSIDPCRTDSIELEMQYINRPWRGFTSLKRYWAKGK